VVQREARFDKSATDITSRRCEQVITGQRVAVAAEHCADFIVEFCLLGGNIYRTEIGPGETRAGHELLLGHRLGGIWEAASGANCPEPRPTELKQSI
jgi:hypothetical protein